MASKNNVLLFIPNLIAYTRVIIVLISFYHMPRNHVLTVAFYLFSVLLDFVNSYTAQFLNQSTRFGAILNHITDRITILGLNVVLISFYSNYLFIFLISIILDIAGHWIRTLVFPLREKAIYKSTDPHEFRILQLYHSSRSVYRVVRITSEIFYVAIYLLHFTEGPKVYLIGYSFLKLIAQTFFPFAVLKTSINILQMSSAFIQIVKEDSSKCCVMLPKEVIEPQDSSDSSLVRKDDQKTTIRPRFLPARNWDLPDDRDSNSDPDKVVRFNQETADELFNLAGSLKELYSKTHEYTKKDIEVLENSSSLVERNQTKLKKSSDMLAEYTKRSCQYWIWLMQILNICFFFSMVLYMKVNRKAEIRYVNVYNDEL